MKRFYEKKDHLIRRNPNLTDGEKQEIIELLGKHPSYENKIDWNKSNSLTYEDFLSILRPLYINDLDPRGLIEGIDYDILYESEDEVLYSVYTYDASKILASNSVEPKIWTEIPSWCGDDEFTDKAHAFGHFDSEHGDMKPGAKWCISMQTSDYHWNRYSPDIHFFFWFRNNPRLGDDRKIAISVSKKTWKVVKVYNGADNPIKMELPSYIRKFIDKGKDSYKEKEKKEIFNKLISKFTLNPQTNRYDYNGSLDKNILSTFVSEGRDGFTINFGKVTGNFDCSRLSLKSFKGAPQEVGGNFNCSWNKLYSFKGAPQIIGGDFDCSYNQFSSLKGAPQEVGGGFRCSGNYLTSLEGAPQKVGGGFSCYGNKLTSLEGVPQKIGGGFNCGGNQLTSLEGAPQEVGENFYCFENRLTSLKGAPQKVGGDFECSENQLTSLEGAPQEVGERFNCHDNQLTSLKGAPQKVGKDFYCDGNRLTSLEGAPQTVSGWFSCSRNKLTSLEGAPTEVGRSFSCHENRLTSLKGAPQKVGEDFNCLDNPNLHSLDGIGEVKGKIYKNF